MPSQHPFHSLTDRTVGVGADHRDHWGPTTTARPIRRPSPPTGIPGVRFLYFSYNPFLFDHFNGRMSTTLAYLAWPVYKHNMHLEFGENSLLDIAHSLVHGG